MSRAADVGRSHPGWFAAALLVAAVSSSTAVADIGALSHRTAAALLIKVLTYDRAVRVRASATVNVGVLAHARGAESRACADSLVTELSQAARTQRVGSRAVHAVALPWNGAADLNSALAREQIHLLYICPGLEAESGAVSALTRAHKVLSVAASDLGVKSGLGMALLNRGSRPTILVNLPAARAEGRELDAGLLGLAEVIR
ncbi:MAG: YfiR family protein [Deltaproteobacteria bacterium]|nr:YfiR family protein [Deltaproteobacteria bacterium]